MTQRIEIKLKKEVGNTVSPTSRYFFAVGTNFTTSFMKVNTISKGGRWTMMGIAGCLFIAVGIMLVAKWVKD